MILRIWRGWTSPERADEYERLLRQEIFPAIEARAVSGYLGMTLGRRPADDEVEFVVLMRFADLDSVQAFTGEDAEAAYVPDIARAVLSRFDDRARHYELVEDRARFEGRS